MHSGSANGGRCGVSWAMLAGCLLLGGVGLFDRDLWTPDEPREAAIMLRMAQTGNWLVPELAGEPFVEKPPLYYIVGAGFIRLLGNWTGPTAALRVMSIAWTLATLLAAGGLARRVLRGTDAAGWTVVVLATLPGFLHVSHWLLVDNALATCVTAALWAMAEAYRGARLRWLVPAGALAAGAFLSKGAIGPLVLAPAWIGLAVTWWRDAGRRSWCQPAVYLPHATALLLFLALVTAWMLAFRQAAGPALWHEWFWENHVGRLTGSAVRLGHRQNAAYYLGVLPVYLAPWIAAIGIWFARVAADWRRRALAPDAAFLMAWTLGGLLLFTLSATKRDIYLAVLMPAFAMMAADVARAPAGPLLRAVFHVWTGILILGLALAAVAPVWEGRVPGLAGGWGYGQAAAAAALAAVALLLRRPTGAAEWLARRAQVMVLAYLALLVSVVPRVDAIKRYGPAFREMGVRLAEAPPDRTGGWALDETTRAGFYYYCGLVLPTVSGISDLRCVLEGRHPEMDSVVLLSKKGAPGLPPGMPPHRVRAEVRMGPRRVLRWLERAAPTAAER